MKVRPRLQSRPAPLRPIEPTMSVRENGSDHASLTLFLDVMRHLQRVDPEFPLQYSICLGEIAMHEGISLTQLAERSDLALSTVSRIVGALSKYRQNNQPFGLVEIRVCATERRRKELYLTPKGWSLIRGIQGILSNR